ncbi:uncharacterized protein LOC134770659 [Penaeus indicus]|uniref:uncharacterized protein LOC134770659 n=1 Tax=Penaeus indicus TaxID=29960 RepID=UPI00300D2498
MNLLGLALVTAVTALPNGYNLPTPSGPPFIPPSCNDGQVLHVDGRCIKPRVLQRAFVYDVPSNVAVHNESKHIAEPKVERNVIFVRLPDGPVEPEPVVIPPPRQQHVLYVLNKQLEQGQRVIEVSTLPPADPEVVFVNYAEGENPTLPGGVDLQTALGSAAPKEGQIISDVQNGGGIGNGTVADGNFGNVISSSAGSTGSGIDGNFDNTGSDIGSGIGSGTGVAIDGNLGNGFGGTVGGGFGDGNKGDTSTDDVTGSEVGDIRSGIYTPPTNNYSPPSTSHKTY